MTIKQQILKRTKNLNRKEIQTDKSPVIHLSLKVAVDSTRDFIQDLTDSNRAKTKSCKQQKNIVIVEKRKIDVTFETIQ